MNHEYITVSSGSNESYDNIEVSEYINESCYKKVSYSYEWTRVTENLYHSSLVNQIMGKSIMIWIIINR